MTLPGSTQQARWHLERERSAPQAKHVAVSAAVWAVDEECSQGGLASAPAVATDMVVMVIPGLVTAGTPQTLEKKREGDGRLQLP